MLRILIVLLLLGNTFGIHAQIITTIAGSGSHSFSGDGGLADTAAIGQPYGCAVDSHGNLYFSTTSGTGPGNRIRKVTPCGIISTVAGIGTGGYNGDGILATTAELNNPLGIAFDSLDNMFIAENGGNRVRKVDAVTGIISTIAGNGTAGYSGDGGAATVATLNGPGGLCIDHNGNLYLVEAGNQRIRKINTDGIISTYAGIGTAGYTGDGGPADSAEIDNLYGICADKAGNIFFEQQIVWKLRKIDTAGIITTIAGDGAYIASGDGGPATDAGLELFGLASDQFGNLYISGFNDNDIRKINDSGIIYTVAGSGAGGYSGDGGPADSAKLYVPYGIAVDFYGNLYIADDGNSRIRKVTFNPVIAPTVTITSTVDTVCSGTSVTFTATVTGGSTSFTYQWLVNGSPAGTAGTYIYTPANGDSIRCVLSVSGLCTIPGSNVIHMVVDTFTVPTITVTAPASVPVGSTVTVNATVVGAGSSYSINWYDNSVLFNTTTVPVVTYVKGAGTDHITATVVPVGGCYDSTTSAAVSVVDSTTASPLPSAGERVSIYPNPVVDLLHVDHDVSCTVRLVDVIGVCHSSTWLTMTDNIIDVSRLAGGIYMVEVTTTDGQKIITKIVKE